MKVNYIGYLVDNMKKSLITFKLLGYKEKMGIHYDKISDAYFCILYNSNNVCVKLIEPASEKSFISYMHQKHINDDYHICYESQSFEQDLMNLQSKGFEIHGDKFFSADSCSENTVFLSNCKNEFIELCKAS